MQDASDRPYHHGDLRRALIETALAILQEERGWQFTLRELARRAGVSHAAPYKHFADKAALLAEIALIGFEKLREALLAAQTAQPANDRDALLPAARAYLGFARRNPALYRLMFGAEAGEPAAVHLDDRARGAFAVVVEFLERGQAAGLIRKREALGQATACWALLHGLAMLELDGLLLREKVGEDAVEAALATLLEGLAA
ncbi:TetR/AcrR family transcriptional regulator [Hansschlegelia zhihuaiae]|uniref:TetR/AcrR family transcriptional regulator n=1 Tax=Hansschlegelia zhihuaiae TaxID=405005 RepID=A0A4Q0MGU0_9HYPH|nr:TetR/AcrR family transcriptional regulator [Hansschlegelia zhihuaiae]RXF72624.1 TetR/AcrR family transcriptional regulator [Hansschlegelia zhihuaiae]